MITCKLALPGNLADVLRGGALTEEQARTIYRQGREAVVFALLELSKQLAEQRAAGAGQSHQTPSTPSGMQPPYQKPTVPVRGKKKPGRKNGHPGSRREPPTRIDRVYLRQSILCQVKLRVADGQSVGICDSLELSTAAGR